MNGRKNVWKNVIALNNVEDAVKISIMRGYGNVNTEWNHYPLELTIEEERTFLKAVIESIKYSRAGLYNRIVRERRISDDEELA